LARRQEEAEPHEPNQIWFRRETRLIGLNWGRGRFSGTTGGANLLANQAVREDCLGMRQRNTTVHLAELYH